MHEQGYPAVLQAMIDRAGSLTEPESDALGKAWESYEDLELPAPSFAMELQGAIDVPFVGNEELTAAWQRALDAAGESGRVDEIEAARAAGRAAHRDDRHLHESESSKNGTEQSVRSAVLAVGVRDLITEADFATLTAPWQRVLGRL